MDDLEALKSAEEKSPELQHSKAFQTKSVNLPVYKHFFYKNQCTNVNPCKMQVFKVNTFQYIKEKEFVQVCNYKQLNSDKCSS